MKLDEVVMLVEGYCYMKVSVFILFYLAIRVFDIPFHRECGVLYDCATLDVVGICDEDSCMCQTVAFCVLST